MAAAGSAALLGGCSKSKAGVRVGYLPITDAAPLLVAHGKGFFAAKGLEAVKPTLFRGWSQLVEAFLAGQVDVVHLLSPVVIWARYSSKMPVKVVGWNHTDGSALTVAPDIKQVADLGGRTVAIPHWYSVHNIVLQELLRANGLGVVTKAGGRIPGDKVSLVVMAPADMVPALAGGQIAGFIVAEPFNALAEMTGAGRILRFTGDVWRQHACCQLVLRESALKERPEWSQKLVTAVVKAELWLHGHRAEAARLLSAEGPEKYTPHSPEVLARVLDPGAGLAATYEADGAIRHPGWEEPRIGFQPYPYESYTEELVQLMRRTQVEGDNRFLQTLDPRKVAADLVDDRFVKKALAEVGGLAAFGYPAGFTRQEELAP